MGVLMTYRQSLCEGINQGRTIRKEKVLRLIRYWVGLLWKTDEASLLGDALAQQRGQGEEELKNALHREGTRDIQEKGGIRIVSSGENKGKLNQY